MRPLLIAVLLATNAISFAAAAQTRATEPEIRVVVEYDKKKDTTTLWLRGLLLWKNPLFQELTLSFTFDFPKRAIAKPKHVLFKFQALTERRLLFPAVTLSVLADGQRFDFGEMSGEWKGPSGGMWIERVETPVSYEDFSRIASAKKVTMILASREYELSDQQLRAVRGFHQVMQREGQQVK